MRLLQVSRVLTPSDSKTNIAFPFAVPESCQRLWFSYSYSPKELTDRETAREIIERGLARYAPEPFRSGYGQWTDYLPLVNLVTLSLDSPEGYCGCAHRHDPRICFSIDRSTAGPGFCPPGQLAGTWRAVINCHAVVTEACQVRLIAADCKEDL